MGKESQPERDVRGEHAADVHEEERIRCVACGHVLAEPRARIEVDGRHVHTFVNPAGIEYTIRWRGLPIRWLTEIEEWLPGKRFVDRQVRGPYRLWHHTHGFEEAGDKTIMEDIVRYALPLGPIGRIAHAVLVRRDLERIFDFRASRIQELMGT